MSELFKLEDRYIVIKRSDVERFWRKDVREQFIAALDRLNEHHVRIPQRKYLVIEHDWPEYEPFMRMLEARVNGVNHEAFGFDAWLENAYTKTLMASVEKDYAPVSDFDSAESARVKAEEECERLRDLTKELEQNYFGAKDSATLLRAENERLTAWRNDDTARFIGINSLVNELRAELDALKAQRAGQKPVAWAQSDLAGVFDLCNSTVITKDERPDEGYVTPLYTAPQPAPAQDVVELELLREYRLSGIAFNDAQGDGYTLEMSNRAEARMEAAEQACHAFYRAAHEQNGVKP